MVGCGVARERPVHRQFVRLASRHPLRPCIIDPVYRKKPLNYGEVLISADHGNAEMMFDPATAQPHTAHTLNRVPCLYVGRTATLKDNGALKDLAPTLLQMMGLPQPPDMTGSGLIQFA